MAILFLPFLFLRNFSYAKFLFFLLKMMTECYNKPTMKTPIYLDYAATTPVDPRIANKMMEYLMPTGVFANASSTHLMGQAAKKAVDQARMQVAQAIYAEPEEIIWTSGATESDNLALKGIARLYQRKGKHIVTLKTEHSAVLDCCQ